MNMKKKIISMMLAAVMLVSLLGGCSQDGGQDETTAAVSDTGQTQQNAEGETEAAEDDDYIIAILTGTVSQSEESYAAAMRLYNEDPDHIVVATYPDNFAAEQETMISTALSFAANPKVKAIVFSQAVAGAAACFQKVKEIRPDILCIAANYADDTATIAENADLCYVLDIPEFGNKLAEYAYDYGCSTVVFYTFARHLAIQTHADRWENLQNRCDELGLNLVQGTTPDPLGDAGVSGCQQYILEDVPRMVDLYGVETGFSGSNTSQNEPMIKMVAETGSYFLLASDPSPFLGFTAALGIEVPEEYAYDADYVVTAIKDKLAEIGMSGHMGSWTAPINTLYLTGGVQYAYEYCRGVTNGEFLDPEVFQAAMAAAAGGDIEIYNVEFNGTTYDNCFYFMCEYEVY